MQRAAIIPEDHIANVPFVPVGKVVLRAMFDKLADQRPAVIKIPTFDFARVS